jgi:hypothetical protein
MKTIAGLYYAFLLIMPRRYMHDWSSLHLTAFYAVIGALLLVVLVPTQRLVSRTHLFRALVSFTTLPTAFTVGTIITSPDPCRGADAYVYSTFAAMLMAQLCLPASLVIQRTTKRTQHAVAGHASQARHP